MRVDAERNRNRIITVALGQFADGGTPAAMQDIAAAAGIGVGTVYRHFPGRRQLMETIARSHLGWLRDSVNAAYHGQLTDKVDEALTSALISLLNYLLAHRGISEILCAADTRLEPETVLKRDEYDGALATLLFWAKDRGRTRTALTAQSLRHLICAIDLAQDRDTPDYRTRAFTQFGVIFTGLGLDTSTLTPEPA